MKLEDRLFRISITLAILLLIAFIDFLVISPLQESYYYKKNRVQITERWEWDNIYKQIYWYEDDGSGQDLISGKVVDFVFDGKYILVAQKPQSKGGINYKCGIDTIYYWIINTSVNRKSGPFLSDEFNQQKRELGIEVDFNREIFPEQTPLDLTAF